MEPIKTTVEELKKTLDADVVVLRGLPGSGKSSFSKAIENQKVIVCSADYYHMVDNKYVWKKENAGKAHSSCLFDFISNITGMIQNDFVLKIIVDNTNTTMSEIETYLKIATAYDLKTAVVCFNVSPETSFKRNIHGVPVKTIARMSENLEKSRRHLLACCKRLGIEYYEIDGE